MINVVTPPSDVTDVTVWLITSNPNPRVLKIERWKNKSKENKMRKENKEKLSPWSSILILGILRLMLRYSCYKLKTLELVKQINPILGYHKRT